MPAVRVAVAQSSFAGTPAENLSRAESLVRRAARDGAKIILLPELFERPYFCKTQLAGPLAWAQTADENPAVNRLRQVAAELQVVLPVSFYQRAGQARFNALAVADADGQIAAVYRKSHIPDGPGYQEKFYFSPGDTGFRPVRTQAAVVGAAICWDQWFPECARVLALRGAELLLYPTAIGDEPHRPGFNSRKHWETAMRGHAAASMIPLAAANRVGTETQTDALGAEVRMRFYGGSFIAGPDGEIAARLDDEDDAIAAAEFDLAEIAAARAEWGIFRDRRPDLYRPLTSLDGAPDGETPSSPSSP